MFFRILKNDIKRTFGKANIIFIYFVFICIFIGLSMWYESDSPMSLQNNRSGYTVFMSVFGFNAYSYIGYILPIIAVLINGTSLYDDNVTSIFQYTVARISKKKYVIYKGISTFICAFVGMFIGGCICLIYSLVKFSMCMPKNGIPKFAANLFMEQPMIYAIYYLIILGLFSSFVVMIANIISIYNKKYLILTMILPTAIVILISIIFIYISSDMSGVIRGILLRYSPLSMICEYPYSLDMPIYRPLLYWLGLDCFVFTIYYILYRIKLNNDIK